jgi:hypothetical protein
MKAKDQDFWRLVAAARDPERLFSVRSNKYCAFYAGHAPDEMQVLIGRTLAEKVLVLFFSKSGGLYDIQRRKLPLFKKRPEKRHLHVNDAEFHAYLKQEFGFRPGLVRVAPFLVADDDCGFWVGPLPWHMNQTLAQLEEYTPEEQAEYRESIRQFIARRVCVLDWGNDWYVLEADGVEAGWSLSTGPKGSGKDGGKAGRKQGR